MVDRLVGPARLEQKGHGVDTVLNRRAMVSGIVRLGAAAVAGAALVGTGAAGGLLEAAAQETGFFRTTARLNLRSGPSTSQRVRLVIPEGALVTSLGGSRNGYRKVSYQGTPGWAHGAYLTVANGGSPDVDDEPVIVGTAVTTTDVNLRAGPSTGYEVLRVLPEGEAVDLSNTYANRFVYVVHEGLAGWVYADYLGPDNSAQWYMTTTSRLNLREQPNTGANVLTVMPQGAKVRATDQVTNGFRRVVYQGITGWAYDAYLA